MKVVGKDDRPYVSQKNKDLLERTKKFSLSVIHFYSALPTTTVAQVLGRQLLRSATSVGAHYREAQRAHSDADFVSKIQGGLQELDEAVYWLELIKDAHLIDEARLSLLLGEAEELVSILVSIVKAAKKTSAQRKT
jgi:four helix bundle protein